MMLIVEMVSILLQVMYLVESTPMGAPFQACESMNPSHGGVPQTTPCPYRFLLDKNKVRCNESVVFKIKAPPGRYFRGIIVQARNEQQTPVGNFGTLNYEISIFSCPGGNMNTVTHKDAGDKEEIDMRWWPPKHFTGDITFYATVAETRETFWVKERVSPVVKVC